MEKVKTKDEQVAMFYSQGDFGYIRERLSELRTYCHPESASDSSFECVDHLRFCRARNIYLDLSELRSAGSVDRYRENVLSRRGLVGGKCKLDAHALAHQGDHKSPLQSWYAEFEHFTEMHDSPFSKCDVIIDEPTFFIKLDAGVNMYHHFCDFVNLYVSQHTNNSFSQNVNIVLWDTSAHEYWSYFSDMWKIFSNKKPIHLKTFDNKKVSTWTFSIGYI